MEAELEYGLRETNRPKEFENQTGFKLATDDHYGGGQGSDDTACLEWLAKGGVEKAK